MATNSGYRVNEDGSVTKINGGGSNNSNNNNSGGSSGNNGCVWFVIIAIVVGAIVAISKSGSSDSYDYSDTDTVVAVEDEVVVDEAVVEEVYTPSATYLSVSDDDIYMSSSGGQQISPYQQMAIGRLKLVSLHGAILQNILILSRCG